MLEIICQKRGWMNLRYWFKLTSVTYEEKFETLLKAISKYQK